eukprot:529345_1
MGNNGTKMLSNRQETNISPSKTLSNHQQSNKSFFEGIFENSTECICCKTHFATNSNELNLHKGDHLNIIKRCSNTKWYVESNGFNGYIPTDYIKLRYGKYIDIFTVNIRIEIYNHNEKYKQYMEFETFENIETNLYQDEDYFNGYNEAQIHQEMLTDTIRTNAYKNAIESLTNIHIKDKIVLDVGCGTGILSIFAAKAGAKHVYAVDASNFVDNARQIIAENKLTNSITVLHGKIEEIVLPIDKVDVIISEWMGHMLITESMISSIVIARDRFLNKLNGLMMPSEGNIYFSPIDLRELYESKMNFFDQVYGVKMQSLKKYGEEIYLNYAIEEGQVNKSNLLCDKPQIIKHFDMYNVTDNDLESFQKTFKFVMDKDGLFCGFGGWFNVLFNPLNINKDEFKNNVVILDTSPCEPMTHWSTTVFPISTPIEVKKGDVVHGELHYFRNNVAVRNYRMFIKCQVKDRIFRKMFDYVMAFESFERK